MTDAVDDGAVEEYYRTKIGPILEKYGPGPRVHYHSGFMDASVLDAPDRETLRAVLVDAQEEVLRSAAQAWDAKRFLSGQVLDVGCGLGGGALYWASEFGAKVTALTNVAEQAAWVERFAKMAGVAESVRTLVSDAHEPLGRERFDAAVAVESSCYLDADRWFRMLAPALRPGGRVHVIDSFEVEPGGGKVFDDRYGCRLAKESEFVGSAEQAGLAPCDREQLNSRVPGFWETSAAWYSLASDRCVAASPASSGVHHQFADAYSTGAVDYLRLSFVRPWHAGSDEGTPRGRPFRK